MAASLASYMVSYSALLAIAVERANFSDLYG